jgi:iron(III) transport system ATP-binding protein
MESGRLVQSGTPADLYARPADPFVASFFGTVNRFQGRVRDGRVATPIGIALAPELDEGSAAEVIVRPEGVRLQVAGSSGTAARVAEQRDLGPAHMLRLALADGSCITVRREGRPTLEPGEEVAVDLDPAHVFVYPMGA